MAELLILALLAFAPTYVDQATAGTNVEAATLAFRDTDIPAEVLLAMAYVESRYSPTSFSRMMCSKGKCKRVTGEWDKPEPPEGARPTFYCGIMQVGGDVPWEQCRTLMTDIRLNYLTGAQHLKKWMSDPRCRALKGEERMKCGLRGYGGGYPGIANLEMTYPNRILSIAARIRRLASKRSNA